MNEQYSETIKELFHDYYEGRLSTLEYRMQRRAILDQMDKEYNGFDKAEDSDSPSSGFDAQ